MSCSLACFIFTDNMIAADNIGGDMIRWPFYRKSKKPKVDTPQDESPSDGSEKDVSIRPDVSAHRPLSVNTQLFPKAVRIARSLTEAPDEWERNADGLTIYHRDSGYTMWIANDDYRMGERIKIGGVYSRTIHYSRAEVEIIWPAVQSALRHIDEREASEFFDRPVKARLRQQESNGTWVCQDLRAEKPWVGIGKTADEAYRTWLGANYPRYREEVMQGRPMVVWRG